MSKLNGEPLSASEVSEGRACLRKWAGHYASDWPDTSNKAATVPGTMLHEVAAEYLSTGRLPKLTGPVAELFMEGLPHLPPPGAARVEHKDVIEIGGLPFTWTADALAVVSDDGNPMVLDHKTSKDPKQYGISSRPEFADNVQVLTYDYAALTMFPHADRVHNRWVYYKKTRGIFALELEHYQAAGGTDPDVLAKYARDLKKGPVSPTAFASDCTLTRTEVIGGAERILIPTSQKLWQLRSKGAIDPNTLPANTATCTDYGGCPHRPDKGGPCKLTSAEMFQAFNTKTKARSSMSTAAPNLFAGFPAMPTPVNGTPAPTPAAPAFQFGAPPAAPAAPAAPQQTAQGFQFGAPPAPAPIVAQVAAMAAQAPAPAAPAAPAFQFGAPPAAAPQVAAPAAQGFPFMNPPGAAPVAQVPATPAPQPPTPAAAPVAPLQALADADQAAHHDRNEIARVTLIVCRALCRACAEIEAQL